MTLLILIVDDDQVSARGFEAILESMPGVSCTWTTNVEEGKQLVRRLCPDVVLLNRCIYAHKDSIDGTENIENGKELLKAIKEYNEENSVDIKVIATSGSRLESVKDEKIFSDSSDCLLPKPFDEKTVTLAIQEHTKHNEQLQILERDTSCQLDSAKINILKKLFHTAKQVNVYPIDPGFTADVYRIEEVDPEGTIPSRRLFCKISKNKRQMKEELRNYADFVQNILPLGKYTVYDDRRGIRYSNGLGGFVAAFVGCDFDSITSFRRYYQRTVNTENIKDILRDLFDVGLAPWHSRRKTRREGSDYALSIYELLKLFDKETLFELFERDFQDFKGTNYVHDSILKRNLYHPRYIIDNIERRKPIETFECICHGDLRCDNILLDEKKRSVILIDFQHTGKKPFLVDFLRLETSVKFDLTQKCDDLEFLGFEKKLAAQRTFGESISVPEDSSPDLKKAFETIMFIREYAGLLSRPYPDFSNYLYGLLLYTLNFLKWEKVELWRKRHCLISSSLMFDAIMDS